jgi:hypothetical protein
MDDGCIVCGKVYQSRQLLYRHQKTIHIVSSIGGKYSVIFLIKITIFCSYDTMKISSVNQRYLGF